MIIRRLPLRKELAITTTALALSFSGTAMAHCDALDGPVINEARTALNSGDITPVLKWVPAEDEAELEAMFAKTLDVRALGDNAQELADQQFFATLVEIHRAYEGAPLPASSRPERSTRRFSWLTRPWKKAKSMRSWRASWKNSNGMPAPPSRPRWPPNNKRATIPSGAGSSSNTMSITCTTWRTCITSLPVTAVATRTDQQPFDCPAARLKTKRPLCFA